MKKLRNSPPVKILVYALFFISCTLGLLLGYVLIHMSNAGVFHADSIEEQKERVISQYEDELLYYGLSSAETFVNDVAGGADISENLMSYDTNDDGVVDGEDVAQLIRRGNFNESMSEYKSYIAEEYGYCKTALTVDTGNDTVTLTQYNSLPGVAAEDMGEAGSSYFLPGGRIEKFNTYKEFAAARDNLADDYDFVREIMPDMVLYSGDLIESSMVEIEETMDSQYKKVGEAVITTDGEGNQILQDPSEETDASDATKIEILASEDGTTVAVLDNGVQVQYIYDEASDAYYPVTNNGYILEYGNYSAVEVSITSKADIYVPDDWANTGVPAAIREDFSIMEAAESYKNDVVLAFAIDFVVCLIMLAFSIALAGKEGVVRKVEKIPVEVIVAAMVVLIFGIVLIGDEVFAYWSYSYNWLDRLHFFVDKSLHGYEYAVLCMILAVGAICTMGLLLINNLVARAKASYFLKTSLIARLLKKVFGKEGVLPGFWRYLKEKTPFLVKAAIVYAGITVVEIIIFSSIGYYYEAGAGLLIILKLICAFCYLVFVCMMHELFKGGEKLKNGEYDYVVNTKYMFGAFKKHGENLNHINEGVQIAVEERMKSERMKTELITNVSHDIKTPLTSIINYVDLLQKENIEKEPEASYIEVIARQSARLKKLIVDLVDASKASTGNVKVELVPMDANMLVEQVMAEYVDKLAEKNISIVMYLSKDRAGIQADGRHLWRVFDNLLNNALKYTMPGTRFYVNTYLTDAEDNVIREFEKSVKTPAKVYIELKNISREPLNISNDELMERFVRGDSSRNTEGSGLGLSITRSLCQLQKAEFNVIIDGDLFKAVLVFAYSADTTESDSEEEKEQKEQDEIIDN